MNKILLILILIVFNSCRNNANQKSTKDNLNTTEINKENSLEGTWSLIDISLEKYNFDSLYSQQNAFITFETSKKRFSGNSSCNSFNGELKIDDNKIDFSIPIIMTKMYCPGEGEKYFMENLHKTNSFNIYNDILTFSMDNEILMKFKRKITKK